MKKSYAAFIVTASLVVSSFAFAADNTNGYYSDQHPKAGVTAGLTAAPAMVQPTAITVINATQDMIYAVVQDDSGRDLLVDTVGQEKSDHIRHSSNYNNTRLVLRDPNQRTFFSMSVCRHAVVTAFGRTGSFRYTVDEEYCN